MKMKKSRQIALQAGMLALAIASTTLAQERVATLESCAQIPDNTSRLECYDLLAARQEKSQPAVAVVQPVLIPANETIHSDNSERFTLSDHWELNQENKRGTFVFRPHAPNYLLLASYTDSPNNAPFLPLIQASSSKSGLSHTELKFQLGFKLKLLENVLNQNADVWFGYTQQSFWQAYNKKASSPFRESNYQPEIMLVAPVDYHFLGWHGRFVNFGFTHQSNGQSSILSRSWNRYYVQTGLEKDNVTLVARAWKRVNESRSNDDNPDIDDYMGYGDLVGTYRKDGHELSMLLRHNFRTDRGAVQLSWAFPLLPRLKGYVQLFSGYGQSLIDYNSYQRAIGAGVQIDF